MNKSKQTAKKVIKWLEQNNNNVRLDDLVNQTLELAQQTLEEDIDLKKYPLIFKLMENFQVVILEKENGQDKILSNKFNTYDNIAGRVFTLDERDALYFSEYIDEDKIFSMLKEKETQGFTQIYIKNSFFKYFK